MNIYIETYGCTANKSDESTILGILQKDKHKIVDKIDDADALILLTCTVIGTTEQRMLSRLRVFKKAGKKIIVSGCMPKVQADLIKSIVPKSILLPPDEIIFINQILKENEYVKIDKKTEKTTKYFRENSAPISIAKGCMFSCTYCITHFARGDLKSFSQEEIISDVKQALKQGCMEIFLTAQDTASYGFDSNDNLGTLLENVCKTKGNYRIRVGMMNPYTAQKNIESIINAYNHEKIYKFIHLPVQSGDNDILKQMNRKYSVTDFKKIVKAFRNKYENITLSTDVIVGFPGESEEKFEKSIKLIKKIKPDILNITRFSPRPLTKAKTMKDRIPTDALKQRSRRLSKIYTEISKQINKNHVGKEYRVLVTKNENNEFIGRSENYKPVKIKEKVKIGEIISVKIIDSSSIHLVGKLI